MYRSFKTYLFICTLVGLTTAGCGFLLLERTVFPNQVRGLDDQPLYIEDLLDVLADDDLSDTETADAIRALGFENEEVIDLIVADRLDAIDEDDESDN